MSRNTDNTTNAKDTTSENEDTVKLLKQLGELKEAGILTEEEFSEKKNELLDKLK